MNRNEIFQLLRNELMAAQNRIDATAKRFDAAIRDIPSGHVHPDEAQCFESISRELNGARQDLLEARGRLEGFLFEGIVPGYAEEFVPITKAP
jgi:hypothetical protein